MTQGVFRKRSSFLRLILPAIAVIAVFPAGLSGCNRTANAVVIWTDIPEMAAILELYNTRRRRYPAELHYREDPVLALRTQRGRPDIIIARHLADPDIYPYLRAVSSLFGDSAIQADQFYADLLSAGQTGDRRFAIPVSFNLPAIVMHRDTVPSHPEMNPFFLDPESIKTVAAEFNRMTGNRFSHLGFSPRWSSPFLYQAAVSRGIKFSLDRKGSPSWDAPAIMDAVDFLRDWSLSAAGSLEQDNRFRRRYLYDPMHQLVAQERIKFAYMESHQFFTLSERQRNELELRWYRDRNTVHVLDDIIWAAMARRPANRAGAEDFLKWLFRPETHELILQDNRLKRVSGFGILDGFSAVRPVNERILPRFYPDLLGLIPPESLLTFPGPLPVYWSELRSEVILPWMQTAVSNSAGVPSLDNQVQTWLLRRGE